MHLNLLFRPLDLSFYKRDVNSLNFKSTDSEYIKLSYLLFLNYFLIFIFLSCLSKKCVQK